MADVSLYSMEDNNTQHNPRELIQRAKAGDSQAFGQLYEMYFVPIFRYVYYRVKDRETADDIVQTVFLNVYKSLPAFQERGAQPIAYFYTAARNAVIDYWRKRKGGFLDAPEETLMQVPDKAPSPHHDIEQRETVSLVHEVIQLLTDDQQDVIILKFIRGLSYREIARLLGKTEEAVRQLQCRALLALRGHLQKRNV